jgi:hypothetical protein
MPAGERSQTWFPELIDELRTAWQRDADWDSIIGLRDRLQNTLEEILASRDITPATLTCRDCGHSGPSAPPRISVRAMLLATKRFKIESADVVGRLDSAWSKHRVVHSLDPYGRAVESGAGGEGHSAHTGHHHEDA